MRSIVIELSVDIPDEVNPQDAADEVFEIIGNEPLTTIEYVLAASWSESSGREGS